jgi:hypothetical protein
MCDVLIVHHGADTAAGEQLRRDLSTRAVPTDVAEFGTRACDAKLADLHLVVVLVPDRETCSERRAASMVGALASRGAPLAVVVPDDRDLPSAVMAQAVEVVRGERLDYDLLFEKLLALVLPRPDWISVRTRPSHFSFPAGVGWWDDAMVVADGGFDRLVVASEGSSSVLLPGLDEPAQVKVDRQKVMVANKGGDSVLLARIEDLRISQVQVLTGACGAPFRSPHGVDSSQGLVAVADTDGNRVLVADMTVWEKPRSHASWHALRGRFKLPCGVLIVDGTVWVADTFNHRLVVHEPRGTRIATFNLDDVMHPVQICAWGDFLFVAHDTGVRMYRRSGAAGRRPCRLTPIRDVAPSVVCAPWGLSVSRQDRLAIADRSRRCVWMVDLPQLRRAVEEPAEGGRDGRST